LFILLSSFIKDITLPLILFGIFAGGIAIVFRGLKSKQVRRDQNATKFQKFGIFLKPFSVTGKIVRRKGRGIAEFEDTLVRAFERSTPVVALGKPGEAWGDMGGAHPYMIGGPGRILIDEDEWKSAVSERIDHASFIICIPSSHPGTTGKLTTLSKMDILVKQCL
jgi:hypothetical protein